MVAASVAKLEEPVIEDNLLFCYAAPDAAERCLAAMREIGKDLRSHITRSLLCRPGARRFSLAAVFGPRCGWASARLITGDWWSR